MVCLPSFHISPSSLASCDLDHGRVVGFWSASIWLRIFFPFGFKGNLSLLEIVFFSRGLEQMEVSQQTSLTLRLLDF